MIPLREQKVFIQLFIQQIFTEFLCEAGNKRSLPSRSLHSNGDTREPEKKSVILIEYVRR